MADKYETYSVIISKTVG